MNTRTKQIFAILAGLAIVTASAIAIADETELENRHGAKHLAAIPDSAIPPDIQAAINDPERPADDRALDQGRKPAQMLTFFEIKPGMQVEDLSAGGGYTTELLARVLGPKGKVYSQNGKFPSEFARIEAAWKARLERLKNPKLANIIAVDKSFDSPDLLPVKHGTLNAVLINMNYHDLVGRHYDMDRINKEIFKALKPGGVYGIIDNSAQPGTGTRDVSTLHRIDENTVIEQVEHAGFKLDAASNALRNPGDDRTWFIFKRRGEQDRFMLKFRKPVQIAEPQNNG